MRILVTGCAGFIGRQLSETLLESDHDVVGLDNFSSGQRRHVENLSRHPRFRFLEHDLTQPLPASIGPVQQIFNLACPASPVDFDRIPLQILDVCSRGVLNLLNLAHEHNARLLHTSTSEVYGDPQVHPQPESYWGHVNPNGPRSCYDEGKRYAEALITAYTAKHAVTTRVSRIFNTYGPGMRSDDGRALPSFIHQALANEPITVHGDGSQTRSFCYVTDQVAGNIALINSDVVGPVNIGNPAEITIADFAREVIDIAGSRSELRFVERPTDDPQQRRPDITRATQLLGWRPTVDRATGLRKTIDWFRASRQTPIADPINDSR